MARKPTLAEARIVRDTNMKRDMEDVIFRLGSIEAMVKQMTNDAKAYQVLQFDVGALQEKVTYLSIQLAAMPSNERVARLEGFLYGGAKVVGGSFLLAVCALVYRTIST